MAALLAVVAVSAGLLLWQFGRPRYRVYTSLPIGQEHTGFLISYPSDWYIEDGAAVRTIAYTGDRASVHMALIRLRHSPPHGLQEWVDEHLYRVNAQEWGDSFIEIGLERAASYRNLDAEARRFEQTLRMLTRRSGTYSIRKSACPAGPVLEIEINNGTSHLQIQQELVIFPFAAPADPQYEVYIQNHTTERLKDRLRQVAGDVVSRIRLVKDYGGASR